MYLIMCLIYPYTLEHWPRKFQFVFGMLGATICGIIIGPLSMFKVNYENLAITIAGWVLIGLFLGIIYLTCVPEMLERMQVDY